MFHHRETGDRIGMSDALIPQSVSIRIKDPNNAIFTSGNVHVVMGEECGDLMGMSGTLSGLDIDGGLVVVVEGEGADEAGLRAGQDGSGGEEGEAAEGFAVGDGLGGESVAGEGVDVHGCFFFLL